MNTYRVTWRIDVETDDQQEAAWAAAYLMSEVDPFAQHYCVSGPDGYVEVDLAEDPRARLGD